jgi:signal transduction histidine kinase
VQANPRVEFFPEMTDPISCPQCSQPVDSQARLCEHCGADLAIAAALAESQLELARSSLDNAVLTPEILVPRLGNYLIEKGVLAPADLERALEYQRAKAQAGKSVLLGQALRELGLVDRETIDGAITVQILQLQSALQQANRELEARVKERTLELERAIEKLTELNKLKANFIANISHELRTPLTHIKGYLDLLSEGSLGELTPVQYNALMVMYHAEERLERLIEDLIQFSLAARGELRIDAVPSAIKPVVMAAVAMAKGKAARKDIHMDVLLPANDPLVLCDAEKIGWVISQLVDNAIKFSTENGSIKVGVCEGDTSVKISITDSGIGIPSGRLSEIFEPFHQLDGSSTRRYSGTGLGLALSRRILEAHDTRFTVTSQPGVGSCFEFSLPVAGEK